jgi:hypothetical protein
MLQASQTTSGVLRETGELRRGTQTGDTYLIATP